MLPRFTLSMLSMMLGILCLSGCGSSGSSASSVSPTDTTNKVATNNVATKTVYVTYLHNPWITSDILYSGVTNQVMISFSLITPRGTIGKVTSVSGGTIGHMIDNAQTDASNPVLTFSDNVAYVTVDFQPVPDMPPAPTFNG